MAQGAPLKRYDDKSDHPAWIKAFADVRRQPTMEGNCCQDVQAIIVAIDQYAESALGNHEFIPRSVASDWARHSR